MSSLAEELNTKLRLEAEFRPILRRYNNKVVREVKKQIRADGRAANVFEFNEDLEEILTEHYSKVSTVFKDHTSPQLPEDVAQTEEEGRILNEALAIWLTARATEQTELINDTTQRDVEDAIATAEEDPEVRGATGTETRLVAAAIAGALLNRRLRGREMTTVVTETQSVAEAAKGTEVEILLGLPPTIQGGSPRQTTVVKEWVSVGDNRVRDAHRAADGQQRAVTAAFDVGGEQLMWPKDTSRGASVGNVINCRCSSIVPLDSIVSARRAR